jgi:hypothetical protein
MLFFGAITGPSCEVAETIATPLFIYNIADEVFCGTVFHGECWWSTEFVVWEQCWVVFDVGDDHRCVKGRENVRGVR